MSETQGIYTVNTQMTDYIPVTCEGCHALIGSIVNINGKPMLTVGNRVTVSSLDGICDRCGAEIHWRTGDVLFERLMQRLRDRRCKHIDL